MHNVNFGPSHKLQHKNWEIPFSITIPAGPPKSCTAVKILLNLAINSGLENFENERIKAFSSNGKLQTKLGNCHALAESLMIDLANAKSDQGWFWCRAKSPFIGDHSWLEYENWAIDPALCSKDRPIIVTSSSSYYQAIKCSKPIKLSNNGIS